MEKKEKGKEKKTNGKIKPVLTLGCDQALFFICLFRCYLQIVFNFINM